MGYHPHSTVVTHLYVHNCIVNKQNTSTSIYRVDAGNLRQHQLWVNAWLYRNWQMLIPWLNISDSVLSHILTWMVVTLIPSHKEGSCHLFPWIWAMALHVAPHQQTQSAAQCTGTCQDLKPHHEHTEFLPVCSYVPPLPNVNGRGVWSMLAIWCSLNRPTSNDGASSDGFASLLMVLWNCLMWESLSVAGFWAVLVVQWRLMFFFCLKLVKPPTGELEIVLWLHLRK